jgi:hypothetical protein
MKVFYKVKYSKGCSSAKYCIYLLTSFSTFAGQFTTQNLKEEFPRDNPENIKEQFSYMRNTNLQHKWQYTY